LQSAKEEFKHILICQEGVFYCCVAIRQRGI